MASTDNERDGLLEKVSSCRTLIRDSAAFLDELERLFTFAVLGLSDESEMDEDFPDPQRRPEELYPAFLYEKQRFGVEIGLYASDKSARADEARFTALLAGYIALKASGASAKAPEAESIRLLSPVDLIEHGLGKTLPAQAKLGQLSESLIPDRPPYLEANVDLALCDLDDSAAGEYLYVVTVSATAQIDEYVLALVHDTKDVDSTLVRSPKICDLYLTRGSETAWEEVIAESLTDDLQSLRARPPGARQGSLMEAVTFERIPPDECGEYLGTDLDHERIALLRADLSSFQDRGGFVRFELTQQLRLARDDHFAFWLADRLYFLDRISVDVTDFSAAPRIQGFMLASPDSLFLPEEGKRTFKLGEWLLPGHGLAIHW